MRLRTLQIHDNCVCVIKTSENTVTKNVCCDWKNIVGSKSTGFLFNKLFIY